MKLTREERIAVLVTLQMQIGRDEDAIIKWEEIGRFRDAKGATPADHSTPAECAIIVADIRKRLRTLRSAHDKLEAARVGDGSSTRRNTSAQALAPDCAPETCRKQTASAVQKGGASPHET